MTTAKSPMVGFDHTVRAMVEGIVRDVEATAPWLPLTSATDAWFAQRRRSILEGVEIERLDPAALAAWWDRLIDDPPGDADILKTMLTCAAVALGDLLARVGFEWGWSKGMPALRHGEVIAFPLMTIHRHWVEKRPFDFDVPAL